MSNDSEKLQRPERADSTPARCTLAQLKARAGHVLHRPEDGLVHFWPSMGDYERWRVVDTTGKSPLLELMP